MEPAGGGQDADRSEATDRPKDEQGGGVSGSWEIVEETVAWRFNAPLLYNIFITMTTEWPALTVAWLPDEQDEPARIALGMHADLKVASESDNQVVVAELAVMDEDVVSLHPWQSWEVPDLGKFQGFGCCVNPGAAGPLKPLARMAYPTEVNRVLPCPVRSQLLATKAATGAVLLYDYKVERKAGEVSPDATLTPKEGEPVDGFALDWSSAKLQQEQLLASGGHDGRLCVWSVNVAGRVDASLLHEIPQAHSAPVGAVSFSRFNSQSLASVGDDGILRQWDLRAGMSSSSQTTVSDVSVMALDWSSHVEHHVATSGRDQVVSVWDLRSMKAPIHRLRGHKDDIVAVRWAPLNQGVLASSSSDTTVKLWDLSLMESADDGLEGVSPELLFSHCGHTDRVSDVAWSDMDEYLLCSVAEDCSVQIWQPHTCLQDGADDAADERGEDGEPSLKRARGDEEAGGGA